MNAALSLWNGGNKMRVLNRYGEERDYPYYGRFFTTESDMDAPLLEREEKEVTVYETACDIQEVSKAANPALIATFSIFFPFDIENELPVRRGMGFSGDMNGMEVRGQVTNVVLSQLNGCVAYVKDYDID